MVFTFLRRADRWYLGSDADITVDGTRSWRGLWDFGRVVARRGRSSLVLAHPGHADRLAVFARTVDDAVPAVTAVWGPRWRRQVAVLLPDTQTEMAALVGERFALARIAAVAIADYTDARTGVARGQRVVVNPVNLNRLSPGRWPGTLPPDRDFRGDAPGLAVAYEAAWTACRLIAARVGTGGLVRFYRLVGARAIGGDGMAAVDAALRGMLHTGYAGFVAQWRTAVRAEL